MKPSKKLQSQLTRLADQGSFHLSRPLKIELKELAEALEARELLNLDCATCVRDTMNSVNHVLRKAKETPVLQKRMTMDIKPEQLKWNELRKHATAKGIKVHGKNRVQILNALHEL